ncbi:MAG: hypothetical protein M3548_04040 [Actinomycetota bacterium]|nr:hypothetical protein [Actinomycetota bacterium]
MAARARAVARYVAKAMAHLVNEPGFDGHVFHLVSPAPQSTKEVCNAFAKAAGHHE